MGSGDWLKTIINRKKATEDRSKQVKGSASHHSNGLKLRNRHKKESKRAKNGISILNSGENGMNIEEIAAIRIQTAYRRYKARKTLHRLKGIQRLKVFTSRNSVKKQTSNTMYCIQSWRNIQVQVRARRASMVSEGHIRQKKQDNQLKLEAKLHELEVEWSGGSETKEEIITRIQQREAAAVKRERAMAYAFSHQWRANSSWNQGPFLYQITQGSWEWSWVENWIAARPWETRAPAQSDMLRNHKTKLSKSSDLSSQRVPGSANLANTDMKDNTKKLLQLSEKEAAKREPKLKHVNSPSQKNKNAKMKQEQLPPQASEVAT